MANTLAYGFTGLEHIFNERVDDAGTQTVYDAVVESAAEHTRQINALMSSVVFRTTDYTQRFVLPSSGALQPLDEWGSPKPVRPAGYFDVAYPLLGGGTAWGTNRVSRALMTVEEANRYTLDALQKDAAWLRRHILAAIMDKGTWTFSDQDHGDLTIQCLANGDTVTYVKRGSADAATDTHYLAQAAAIADDTSPFATIYTELMEHPSNRGPIVCYVADDLSADIEALTNFVPVGDPDLNYGLAATTIAAAVDRIRGMGQEVLGKVDKCWVVEWGEIPDGYIIAHAVGAGPFLAQREYPATSLQGFFPELDTKDGNYRLNKFLRYCGFGVANRVAALCYFIEAGDTTYDVPSGYDRPILD